MVQLMPIERPESFLANEGGKSEEIKYVFCLLVHFFVVTSFQIKEGGKTIAMKCQKRKREARRRLQSLYR